MEDNVRLLNRLARKEPRAKRNVHAPDIIRVSFSQASEFIMLPAGRVESLLCYVTMSADSKDRDLKASYKLDMTVIESNVAMVTYSYEIKNGTNEIPVKVDMINPSLSFKVDSPLVQHISMSVIYTITDLTISKVEDDEHA